MSKGQRVSRNDWTATAPPARHPLQLQRKCACGGGTTSESECPACQAQNLQRRAEGGGAVNSVPRSVSHVLRSPGAPLDAATRAVMEPHFRHDFSKVRVHADGAAAESAKAVQAAAYTVGRDVVFGSGRYEPATARGRQLIAHELMHVMQQGQASGAGASGLTIGEPGSHAEQEADGAARSLGQSGSATGAGATNARGVSLQRAPDEWGKEYGQHKSFLGHSYEDYKSGLGEFRETTKGGLSASTKRVDKINITAERTPAAPEITLDVLKEIYPTVQADLASGAVKADQIREYLDYLNTAFKMMKLNTVEAQAYYLANAFIESQQFRLMTETDGGDQAHWDKSAKTPDSPGAKTYYERKYPKGGAVNPYGNEEFIGRGPVQVTFGVEYVEALAMIERAGEDYQKLADKGDKQAAKYAALAKRAVKAIKKDSRQAANPEFSFLFSAAFLKGKGNDVNATNKDPNAAKWTGRDAVGGGDFTPGSTQDKSLTKKAAAYHDIYCVLMRVAKDSGVKEAEGKHLKKCAGKRKASGKAAGY